MNVQTNKLTKRKKSCNIFKFTETNKTQPFNHKKNPKEQTSKRKKQPKKPWNHRNHPKYEQTTEYTKNLLKQRNKQANTQQKKKPVKYARHPSNKTNN